MESKLNKKEFVKSLNKVKVVLGNGFDLHCGLRTRYQDYFLKYHKTYDYISYLFSNYSKSDKQDFHFMAKEIDEINVWDIFFVIVNSFHRDYFYWCDVERLMLCSFIDNTKLSVEEKALNKLSSIVNWREIKEYISKSICSITPEESFVVLFCKNKMSSLNIYPNNFYKFILDELKSFEKKFGNFIDSQLHDINYERSWSSKRVINRNYVSKASETLNELCDLQKLVGIDTFNYSYIESDNILDKIQHINGTFETPIFGIDSIFDPKDECYVFTKTSRRIDIDLFDNSYEAKPIFENLVVYGHSLNEADYSYFFPVFDKLNLTNSNASNIIVFAYTIHNAEKEDMIKREMLNSISNIMFAYAKSKNLSDPKRFLDSLSTQKRIVTYEIPLINEAYYSKSKFDYDWEELDKLSKTKTS